MIFETEIFHIDIAESTDLNDIVEVYSSNKSFLRNHMNADKVTYGWMLQELESMKAAGFCSCKVVEKSSGKLIGIIDFKIGEEIYLSLLMVHNDYKNKGFGKLIYKALEEYAKSKDSNCMRIDVVTGYDDKVLDFWVGNGFVKYKDIELNWTGKVLPAVIMKRSL
jgi:GNAT superfamily N-acetyltransferase